MQCQWEPGCTKLATHVCKDATGKIHACESHLDGWFGFRKSISAYDAFDASDFRPIAKSKT